MQNEDSKISTKSTDGIGALANDVREYLLKKSRDSKGAILTRKQKFKSTLGELSYEVKSVENANLALEAEIERISKWRELGRKEIEEMKMEINASALEIESQNKEIHALRALIAETENNLAAVEIKLGQYANQLEYSETRRAAKDKIYDANAELIRKVTGVDILPVATNCIRVVYNFMDSRDFECYFVMDLAANQVTDCCPTAVHVSLLNELYGKATNFYDFVLTVRQRFKEVT